MQYVLLSKSHFAVQTFAPGLTGAPRRASYLCLRGPKVLILSIRSLRTPGDEPMVNHSAAAFQSLCRVIGSAHRSSLFLQSGSSHNNLRISRILKCLSEFGYEYLNYGFLLHVLNEQSEHGQLNTSIIRSSMDRWWANCIRRDRARDWINQKIATARDRDVDEPFVFTREMYEAAINNWNTEGRF